MLHQKDYQPAAPGPLNGIRILDLSRLFAGNVMTQILGDAGADVVKVEPPDGDTLRSWKTQGIPTHWINYARNKRSLCLNLRDPRAIEALKALVPTAHLLIESFRPGVLEKMGLAPAVLHAINPRLVIVRISGWGQDGPYAQRGGFGTLIEGISGFAAVNGFPDREPVLPPMYLADATAGQSGAAAALIALRAVEVGGGQGQVIDLPLLDPLFSLMGPQAANYRITGKVRKRSGNRSTNTAPRNAYRCSDGLWVGLSASIQKMAERTFRAIGRPDMVDDPRYRTHADRMANVEEIDAIIGAFIATRTQAENVAFFEAAEVTIGPIYDITQIVDDPHFIEREIIADYPDDAMGRFPMHTAVPRLEGTPLSIRSPAPRLGQHSRAVLSEAGMDTAALDALVASGVVIAE